MNPWLANPWLAASLGLLPCLALCAAVAAAGGVAHRFVALQLAAIVVLFQLMLLAVGYAQPSFIDLALTTVLLSFPGTLAYAHFLERWL